MVNKYFYYFLFYNLDIGTIHNISFNSMVELWLEIMQLDI